MRRVGGEVDSGREKERKRERSEKLTNFAKPKNPLCLSSNADVSSEETIRLKTRLCIPKERANDTEREKKRERKK